MSFEIDLTIAPPGTVSFPLESAPVETFGCLMSDEAPAPSWLEEYTAKHPAEKSTSNVKRTPGTKSTRLSPPRDVIRLEDRLQYLLQPPLETLLNLPRLRLPFEPFPYQLEGIAFLYPRYHAVLADEMGLGKTMQAITTMRLLLHQREITRALLICPKPLVTNWQREIAMWAPELPVSVIEGSAAKRNWLWNQQPEGILITNYEAVVRDQAVFQDKQLEFDLVVLDESQRVKNKNGTTSQIVRSIQRKRSWAITGTPIENSLEDLVGIFEFVQPGQLHSDMKPRAMRSAVSDHIVRRTKDQVLDQLPPKLYRDANATLTNEQQYSYQQAEEEGVVQLQGMGNDLTIHHVFELILRLKQICNFDPATGASSKLDRLEADLEECVASGRKAIVFSQWVQSITMLKERLSRFNPGEYHGKVPHRKRDGVIEKFRSDPNSHVLLMSYGAGSVGLNLQFAGYVFLFDRWWNPAVEDQAINRAHRIGATGPVTVTRFLTLGTIEERINEILEQKRELFASIFSGDQAIRSKKFSREEIFSLFELPSAA